MTDQPPRLGLTIPRDLLELFVGCDLTDQQVTRIQECLPHSSIPDALSTIAGQFIDHPDGDGDDAADTDNGGGGGDVRPRTGHCVLCGAMVTFDPSWPAYRDKDGDAFCPNGANHSVPKPSPNPAD